MEAGGRRRPIFDTILNAGGAIAGGLLVVVMLIICIKVVFRYFLHEGLIGIDQISGTMMVYITFFGAAWVLRREEHVTIDFVVMQFGPDIRRRLNVLVSAICSVICLVVTVFGAIAVISSWQKGILIPAEIEIPRAINLAVIPLGACLLLIQFIRRGLFYLRGDAVENTKSEG